LSFELAEIGALTPALSFTDPMAPASPHGEGILVSVGPMARRQRDKARRSSPGRRTASAGPLPAILARQGWQVALADIDGEAVSAAAPTSAARPSPATSAARRTWSGWWRSRAPGSAASMRSCRTPGIGVFEPMPNTTLESWNRVLATNLTATFLLAKAAAADLKGARGAIVTIASTRAHMSEPDTLAYSASKGGLVALTHALAITLAPDVRVNCVSPGWIDSGKHGPLKPADHAQHPVGRVGRPEDVAAAVAYLLSEEAGFITGAELIVDGGMTRKMIYA
jgi:NAD(P)-dependent dehydrogenase (short-subunit alcohol dehydrogenase family)